MTQNIPPLPGPAQTGLSPAQMNELATARRLGRKVRRASNVAMVGGCVTAFFAMVTLIGCIFSFSLVALLLGLGMSAISIFEFRGAGEIKRLDQSAPLRLSINQIAFMLLIIIYAAVSLWQALRDPTSISKMVGEDPEIEKMLGNVDDLARTIVYVLYFGVMIAAVLGPGMTAIYYITRTKFIKAYAEQTPQWILNLQRAGMSV